MGRLIGYDVRVLILMCHLIPIRQHGDPLMDLLKAPFKALEGDGGKPVKEASHLLRSLQLQCRVGTALCMVVKIKIYLKTCCALGANTTLFLLF